MVRGTTSNGTKKCRKFTFVVGSVDTMPVISTALPDRYCALNRYRNGYSAFVNPFPLIQRGMMRKHFAAAFIAASTLVAGVSHGALARNHARTIEPAAPKEASGWVSESGKASYYGQAYNGRKSANGTRFDQKALTAAHAWLPFGTKVRVMLAGSTRSVIVTITDRMYSTRRVVDLSVAAARELGMISRGIAHVTLVPA
jgi:rare lipoprotein A